MSMHLVVIGDMHLARDITGHASRSCPDSYGPVVEVADDQLRPGGAALAAVALATFSERVTLVTTVASDRGGRLLQNLLRAANVDVIALGPSRRTLFNTVVRTGEGTVVQTDAAWPFDESVNWERAASATVLSADAVLLSDCGRGMTTHPGLLPHLFHPRAPVVWDPHLRGSRPAKRPTLATPNLGEARLMSARLGLGSSGEPGDVARELAQAWGCGVAVTCGADGSAIAINKTVEMMRAPAARPTDACGVGEWFAAGALFALASGGSIRDAVDHGTESAGRWIPTVPVSRKVATSGSFDGLHVGHLAQLRFARALGSHLTVFVNSDASMRRLKGTGQPVNPMCERAELLRALDCVDEVIAFDEDTPCSVLRRHRPDVFVPGEELGASELLERDALKAWGGQLVSLGSAEPGRPAYQQG